MVDSSASEVIRIPTRDSLVTMYRTVRERTRTICDPLQIEDMVVQSATECSPVKWQLGHTTWFFETFVLNVFDQSYRVFDEHFGFLFNSYYNALGDRVARPIRGLLSRPTVVEIINYRAHVDRAVERLLEKEALLPPECLETIVLGLHHEEQHQELIITDVKTVLALNPTPPVYRDREIISRSIPALQWHDFDAGLYTIGYDPEQDGPFGFDNERSRHQEYLELFRIANRLITNAEYLRFMEDGGYSNPLLWLSDGWAMIQSHGWAAPMYWRKEHDGAWYNVTLQGLRLVEPSEPVTHISYFEADAFATWSGARLASESEWEVAARHARSLSHRSDRTENLFERGNYHPVPLNEVTGDPAQFFGDTWEWTRSAYLAYPGFQVAPGAIGEYNGKFMSGQMVLRGGSCVTPQDHIRASYRNFFPPESRWQFSGIRLAKDA